MLSQNVILCFQATALNNASELAKFVFYFFFSSTIVIGTIKYLYSAATMQNYYNGQTKPKKYSCVVFDGTVIQNTENRIFLRAYS